MAEQTGLSTKIGTDLKATVWGAAGIVAPVVAMIPSGWMQLLAFETFIVGMVLINWKMTGSGLTPEQATKAKKRIDEIEQKVDVLSPEELVKESRELGK